jgi:hypothetical protein
MDHPFDPSPSIRRLMIFGHPAHELALFGAIQRFRPEIAILTDGGSSAREGYSRSGFARIEHLDHVQYLGFREADFYAALLNQDAPYFDDVVNRLRSIIRSVAPDQIFCDAVEFYNPVHDIVYPLVRAAMQGISQAPLFRIPLVYQRKGTDSYAIQRVPEILSERCHALQLDEREAAVKCAARDEIYLNLRDQADGDFMAVSLEHAAREEVESDLPGWIAPGDDGRELRYEWRAHLLQERGEIRQMITYQNHFLPMVERYSSAVSPQNVSDAAPA